ncbi:MAG: FAD-dependent oxidoreductase, partial [Candidatus Cybelea sp.]
MAVERVAVGHLSHLLRSGDTTPSVAVVGGGLAGLSAALRLKQAGVRVELFERSRLLGGRATSFEIGGVEVDNGQHVFLACCEQFIGFARSVGMEHELRLQDRFD